jgi:hypothetical protein
MKPEGACPVRRGARGHNCVAQFGPSGNYNSNCDKNGIEEVFTTYYNSWLDNQIRRIFTIMTPGATGGSDNVDGDKSAAADGATSISLANGVSFKNP